LTFDIDESHGATTGDMAGDDECGIDSVSGLVEGTEADGDGEVNIMSHCNFLFVSSWNRPFIADFS